MIYAETSLPGVMLITTGAFHDERGFFMESYNHKAYKDIFKNNITFVQDNHSRSFKNVARGLHYQLNPKAQGKLVRVINGAVYDVVVNICKNSELFGQWRGFELSDDNRRQLWIPPGYAHGFVTLSKNADVIYKTTEYYDPDYERIIAWDDKDIGIEFPENLTFEDLILSQKDLMKSKRLAEADLFDK